MRSALVLGLLVLSHSGNVLAQQWPSFRGPKASGIADGLDLPTTWDAEAGENVLWETAIPGLGHSSPVVWGDRVFLTTAVSEDPNSIFIHGLDGKIDRRTDLSPHSWRVYALDGSSGAILWQREAHAGTPRIQRHRKNTYASATPVTDGKHLVVWFGSEGLHCYDLDGRLLWKQELGVMDAGASYDDTYDWGIASSPIIHENLVIVLADGQGDSFIAAFDLRTGKRAWRTSRDVISSFSTPTVHDGPPRAELIVNGAQKVHGYDPQTGRQLWELRGSSKNTTPTPIVAHGLFFVVSGYRVKPIFAIRPGASGDITPEEGTRTNEFVAWSSDRDGSYITTPIVYGDYLYTCQNNGVLACFRARTGERVYRQRVAAGTAFSASPIAADGRLYFTSEDGEVYVVRAGPRYELLATNRMGDVCMATPAVSQGQIIFRTLRRLVAVGDGHPSP
jgi:outer membrane protein assembly factor BamB